MKYKNKENAYHIPRITSLVSFEQIKAQSLENKQNLIKVVLQ